MNRRSFNPALWMVCAAVLYGGVSIFADVDLDSTGVSRLRAVDSTLTGSGVRIGHPEASESSDVLLWEVCPTAWQVFQPMSLFTWENGGVSTNYYPNSLGSLSGHAVSVATIYYGTNGVAPGVSHVDTYQADYFITNYVEYLVAINSTVVNQSYADPNASVSDQMEWDSFFDDYVATYGTLFVSGAAGNHVSLPATAYNSVAVGTSVYSGTAGPTIDNGRSKPDIIAPGSSPSFTAPYVSGIAVLLVQAAWRGDGGSDTNAASDARTIKALLLNGAVKPTNWFHSASMPLDKTNGAGLVNACNSYVQLAAGRHSSSTNTTVLSGNAHPPVATTNSITTARGWDFAAITSAQTNDAVRHYVFDLSTNRGPLIFTATLAWNRGYGQSNINDLDLFLYDTNAGTLMACSTSRVDNVEHLYISNLTKGCYDLQVLKRGGTNWLTETETFALAFEFASQTLQAARCGTNTILSWPLAPAGFSLQSTTNLSATNAWTTVTNAVVITNQENQVTVVTGDMSFFRLSR